MCWLLMNGSLLALRGSDLRVVVEPLTENFERATKRCQRLFLTARLVMPDRIVDKGGEASMVLADSAPGLLQRIGSEQSAQVTRKHPPNAISRHIRDRDQQLASCGCALLVFQMLISHLIAQGAQTFNLRVR